MFWAALDQLLASRLVTNRQMTSFEETVSHGWHVRIVDEFEQTVDTIQDNEIVYQHATMYPLDARSIKEFRMRAIRCTQNVKDP